ncbi:hypothetical protein [Streptomyces lushanensis]|uniref:hypothetical protein n=1 Tax=Streptomyces lushanensis TaxID=1434255 RepID=UPI00083742E9|nr:hypothetical protein [Streptomyces lushanensis]
MSTVLIVVALAVVFVVVVAAVLYIGPGRASGRSGLKRRFGPEYDRVLARHDGDSKATEHELAERLERHGELRPGPLPTERRDQYVARWAELQERFVDEPREAVVEADRLLAQLAADRGYPAGTEHDGRSEEQLEALSVHHAYQVDAYRRMHRVASADGRGVSTEELRETLVAARQLFDRLILGHPDRSDRRRGGAVSRNRNLTLRPKGSGV